MNKLNVIYILYLLVSCEPEQNIDSIYPEEDTGFLQIPGVGWQTFHHTADEDNSLQGLPFKSGSAYYRYNWKDLEPQEGQYAFDRIDNLLKRCRQNNQALALRIMCEVPGGEALPQWLIDKGIKRTYSTCPEAGAHYVPDMSDPVFQHYHRQLILAFGQRYDDHPDLALVDIGSVGLWGEWHISCDPDLMPSREIRQIITNTYIEAFPNTPLTALVGDETNVDYAVEKGNCGWRGDSWGDADISDGGWSHHQNMYWPTHDRVPDAWKTGTIALEPGVPNDNMIGWTASYINEIVDDAIAWHATFAHNKSYVIPQEYINDIERLVMKMGFRLVLRKISFNDFALPGSKIPITMTWENIGIAPPYRDHRIALRLKNENNDNQATVITDVSICGWLPGETSSVIEYDIPTDLLPGNYTLELGIVYHNSLEHNIPIANKGKTEDGWYKIGIIQVDSFRKN